MKVLKNKLILQLETNNGLLSQSRMIKTVIYKDFYLDVAQGWINEAPNETRTHSNVC